MQPYKRPLDKPPPISGWPLGREVIAYAALQTGLLTLKLLGLAAWSWWWIMSPTLLVVAGFVSFVLWLINDRNQ